ncbi:MAG: glycerophosphodiester phosphodiesterase family protein [Paludisphaera borealis]|uniref:glycerophosphodiester phosphodiesterase n=1 Tax=Paludisphaera borealis TaxID=1387353 RepID=UPI00284EFEC6|nr:glycerophosphodiester phosphodiesterase family protein [Paludisphaera borealis]MDR3620388.1 glycerophosphodiester phosphodiesterase family protein [Paludisphaera borealis]
MTFGNIMMSVCDRARRRAGPLVSFSVAFSLVEWAILTPLVAGILRLALGTWGRCSVGNFEILSFLLSPVGLAGLALIVGVQFATLHLRLAGLMAVLSGDGPGVWHALDVLRRLPALIRLGLLESVAYLLLAVPFAIAGAAAYFAFWSSHDVNRLVVVRPPEFWRGAAAFGVLALLYLTAAGWLYLRWLLAPPAVLFEDVTNPKAALRSSAERLRGRLVSRAVLVLGFLAVLLGAYAAVTWSLGWINGWVLGRIGHASGLAISATAALLLIDGLVVASLSALAGVAFAAIILDCYQKGGGAIKASEHGDWNGRLWSGTALVLSGLAAALAVVSATELIADARVSETIEVTAHRAGAFDGPENTLAALRHAIEASADWAEIDVQFSADKRLVVIHDTDLLRVAGSPLRVAASTLDQLRAVDLGSPFSPAFAGERIATLEEFLDAAGTAIRLNIELKPKNEAEAVELTDRVLEAVRKAGMLDRDRVCSQSFRAIQTARRAEPGLEVGFITGAVIGDPTRLDVDFLMVDRRLATRALVDRASQRDVRIHAWTINNPDHLAPLIDHGVANIITDDVAAIRARLTEIRDLDPLERLLLRVRNGLIGS